MTVTIRPVQSKDLAALRDLYLLTRTHTFTWLDASSFQLADFDLHTEEESTFVALTNTQLVGFVSLWLPKRFVHHLYVHPNYLRKGIGKQLLNYALNTMGHPSVLKCLKQNQNALQFYLAQNWQIAEEAEDEEGVYYLMVLDS